MKRRRPLPLRLPPLRRSDAFAVAITLAALHTFAAGCGAPAKPPPSGDKFFGDPTGASGVSSSTDAERYFPLVDGTIFHYETQSETGGRGVLIARVHRTDATHGELLFPSGKKRFVYTPQGVVIEPQGTFVLAVPIAPGTTFRGQNGGRAVIEDTQIVIDVKAGSFRDCVRVVEDRGGDRPARFATTFCPDVGVVSLEVQAGLEYERAELVSAGPPVNIERDGVTVIPGETPPPPQ